jgi:hypothetical protein
VDRRLEDRIRGVSAKLIDAEDDQEFQSLVIELRASLSAHIERLRAKLRDYPFVVERRSSKE